MQCNRWYILSNPRAKRGDWVTRMAVRGGIVLWGVWGGFPPIIGRTRPPPPASRGGVWGGSSPPILGRKDFGGPGEAGEKGGSGRGSAAPSVVVVVCLSVTGRTSPSCLGRSRRNFRWGSGSWSGTFISGTGPIGQGSWDQFAP